MENHFDAIRAIQELNNKIIDENDLYCCRALSKSERLKEIQKSTQEFKNKFYNETKKRNLYIKGFDIKAKEEDLKEYFSKFGQIESLFISKDSFGKSKKFGFVCFQNDEDAENAIRSSLIEFYNNQPIYVAFAQPKEERERINSQIHNNYISSNKIQMKDFDNIIQEIVELGMDFGLAKKISKCFSNDQIKVILSDREIFHILINSF